MNYHDWKTKNPNKSINDYFIAFPHKKLQSPLVLSNPVVANNASKKVAKKEIDYLLILASILIIIAFFLPWVNINLLSINLVNSSGSDMPDILRFVYKDTPQIGRFVKAVYLIPIGAFLVLFGETARIFSLKAIGEVMVFMLSIAWFYALYAMFNFSIQEFGISISIGNFYAIGMYLTLAGSLYYFVDIIKGFFD